MQVPGKIRRLSLRRARDTARLGAGDVSGMLGVPVKWDNPEWTTGGEGGLRERVRR